MNEWYRVGCRYTKEFKDGTLKRVTEFNLINAISFTDAETRVHEEIGTVIRGEFVVTTCAKVNISDVFRYEDADKWWKVKVQYISEDADSGREKKVTNYMLVEAHNAKEAYERVTSSLTGLMVSYEMPSISLMNIQDIYPYKPMDGDSEEE